MSALLRLATTETKLFFREPMSVLFALAFPPLLLIILGAVPAFRELDGARDGLRVIDVYTPIVGAMAITTFAIAHVPQQFATYREKGILRRLQTTPAKPTLLLAAQLLMCSILSVGTMLVVLVIARLLYAVSLPQHVLAFLMAYLLAALAMFAIGLLVAALAPSGASAGAIGLVLFFPMLFFAGLWIPRDSMNAVLLTISDFTPLGAAVQSLQDATVGDWPQLLHVIVLLAWMIAAVGLAARYFRWE